MLISLTCLVHLVFKTTLISLVSYLYGVKIYLWRTPSVSDNFEKVKILCTPSVTENVVKL